MKSISYVIVIKNTTFITQTYNYQQNPIVCVVNKWRLSHFLSLLLSSLLPSM